MTDKVTNLKLVRENQKPEEDCQIGLVLCPTCHSSWMKVYQCITHGDLYLLCANCETPMPGYQVRLAPPPNPDEAG